MSPVFLFFSNLPPLPGFDHKCLLAIPTQLIGFYQGVEKLRLRPPFSVAGLSPMLTYA